MNLASSPEFTSNRAGPSKGKQRARQLVSSHRRTRVTRAMSRSNALPGDLDPTALNNIPEEDEPQDWGASPSPTHRSRVVGTPEPATLALLGTWILISGTLLTGRSASSRRLPTLASPGLVGAVNPLHRLLSPVATSTPWLSHAGNASMHIQALLNSVPRYPTAVASSHSGNQLNAPQAVPQPWGSIEPPGQVPGRHVNPALAVCAPTPLLLCHRPLPCCSPPFNRLGQPFMTMMFFRSSTQTTDAPPSLHLANDPESHCPRPTISSPHMNFVGLIHQISMVSKVSLQLLAGHVLAHPWHVALEGTITRSRLCHIGIAFILTLQPSIALALLDPSEQDHTMAVSQTVRILPEVITALRKDLRIKSKDLSHFDLARVSTDDFGKIAKTMPKALEAFLIMEKSHSRTGSEHALAIADFPISSIQSRFFLTGRTTRNNSESPLFSMNPGGLALNAEFVAGATGYLLTTPSSPPSTIRPR
ncbi:hypothetical protein F5879DRAFT_989101 [Lentinula edodes]|nr:hypothetical protein F5879DRAFT_989101 [Lentinula edodes]